MEVQYETLRGLELQIQQNSQLISEIVEVLRSKGLLPKTEGQKKQ